MIKIVADSKIPFLKNVFEPSAVVVYKNGIDISNQDITNADALIVRTRTKCNGDLLKNSSVRFIATATIGFDHIDTAYCQANKIEWRNAPGCNSSSVLQYVAASLFLLAKKKHFRLRDKTIGIVGVGNIGTKVARFCKTIGMQVLQNDPPRQKQENLPHFVSLEQIQSQADIITFHVPLKQTGKHKTFHMAEKNFFASLKKKPILINAARGEIISTQEIVNAIKTGKISSAVIDCWENEPNINAELFKLANIATPHIAGYSLDGKAGGTLAAIKSISDFFSLNINVDIAEKIPPPKKNPIKIDCTNKSLEDILAEAILHTYKPQNDDWRLRKNPEKFEFQRANYPIRREFEHYDVQLSDKNEETAKLLSAIGFRVL